jgi:hypothetical protein
MKTRYHLPAFLSVSRRPCSAFPLARIPSTLAAGVVAVVALSGCMSSALPQPQSASVGPAAGPTTVASETTATRSALSYGAVTGRVEKNKTMQLELLEMFGGPNISTTDADGTEVWIYERIVTQTDVATNSRDFQGAVNLGVSFGFTNWGGNAGGSAASGTSSAQVSNTTSTRTLTVIVKFNPEKSVKDFAVRATYF